MIIKGICKSVAQSCICERVFNASASSIKPFRNFLSVKLEIIELVERTKFINSQILKVSTVNNQGIDSLKQILLLLAKLLKYLQNPAIYCLIR